MGDSRRIQCRALQTFSFLPFSVFTCFVSCCHLDPCGLSFFPPPLVEHGCRQGGCIFPPDPSQFRFTITKRRLKEPSEEQQMNRATSLQGFFYPCRAWDPQIFME